MGVMHWLMHMVTQTLVMPLSCCISLLDSMMMIIKVIFFREEDIQSSLVPPSLPSEDSITGRAGLVALPKSRACVWVVPLHT